MVSHGPYNQKNKDISNLKIWKFVRQEFHYEVETKDSAWKSVIEMNFLCCLSHFPASDGFTF